MPMPHHAEALNQRARVARVGAAVRAQPAASAGEAFRVIGAGCLERFHAHAGVLVASGDAEALHQSRVTLRQLRSALSIFEPVVHDIQFEPLREGLGWLAATMNETRDLDTLIARYEVPPAQLVRSRKRALAQASRALGSARARHLSHDLAEWLDHGIWLEVRNPPGLSVTEFATESLDRLYAKLEKKGRQFRPHNDKSTHKLRIVAKKLRYATEFFAGLFPGSRAEQREQEFGKAIRKLQDRLGELRDRSVASVLLERLDVPDESRPELPHRGPLQKRARRKLAQLLECKPYWT